MTNQIEALLDCLSRLIRGYSLLLESERSVIDCYLEGRLEDAERNREVQERQMEEIRLSHAQLKTRLSGGTLAEFLSTLPAGVRFPLDQCLQNLHRTIAEVSIVIQQNRRFTQNSAAFCQGILQRAMRGSCRYDQQGFLQSPGTRLGGGLRV